MAALLEAIPGAQTVGVDLDPTMLLLAEKRLEKLGDRVQIILTDLRDLGWLDAVSAPRPAMNRQAEMPSRINPAATPESASADFANFSRGNHSPARPDNDEAFFHAVVSATALHWLSPDQLSALYTQIAGLLHPGGIFLNADHVGSEHPLIQPSWEAHREEMRARQPYTDADDWDGFWCDYLDALGDDARQARQRLLGPWEGVEQGKPLAWHFHQLCQTGFTNVDCFWRCDCDAIYGGVC
jgi:hypothetical protein